MLALAAALLGALEGCGFVAGVDFFGLERGEDAGTDAAATPIDGGANEAGRPARIYVLGGTDDASALPPRGLSYVTEIQPDGSLGAWSMGPDLPLPRIYAAGIAGADFVAMVGGITVGHGERANLAIGRATDGVVTSFFESSDAYPTPRARAGAARHGGTIFVLGGVDAKGVVLTSVQHGTANANGVGTFAASPPLPTPRARMAVATSDTELYVVGGGEATAFPADILVSHFGASDLSAFAAVGALPSGRVYAQAVVTSGALLVIGGETPRALTDVLRFPIGPGGMLGASLATAPLPVGTGRHQVVLHGTHLYVIGGNTEHGVTTNVFVGDVTSDGYVSRWRATTALPAPLMFHSAVTL
ncbi:MAG: putative serine/threonine-protein kinase pknK [Labilithrix sp.]|nr:putative serine/threonine-protein kinase pknK [Labilithrix sp.]